VAHDDPVVCTVRFFVATVFVSCVLLAAGCSSDAEGTRVELVEFLRVLNAWAPADGAAAGAIERVLATQFVDDAEVRHQVTELSARVSAHLAKVAAYHPRSPEVAALYTRYRGAWEQLSGGCAEIEAGLDQGVPERLAGGREALEAWADSLASMARDTRRLAERVGVDPRMELDAPPAPRT